MKKLRLQRTWIVRLAVLAVTVFGSGIPATAQPLRVLGVDISYWNCGSSQAGIGQGNWTTGYTTGNRQFAWIRATRGGTTGVDQPQGTPGGGTTATLSHRYDDPRFIQNINYATTAGMVAGPYHFARPDVAGNTGTDEADHFIQMAGPWMRPGYMMPMYDMEAGSGSDTLAQYIIDFSTEIYAAMKIRPCIYINGNYSTILQGATQAHRDAIAKPAPNLPTNTTPSAIAPGYPMLWDARYPPTAYDVQTDNPKDTYSGFYGPWDDYGDPNPWSFWQYASTNSIPGFNNVDSSDDGDVAHGDIEYVRNYLVPAVWWNDSSGDWSVLANWNCGQTPTNPVTPPDQAVPYSTSPLPTARLPGASGSGPTSGQYDTVILERPSASIAVTLSTGSYNIRKLYMREALNITGGSLTINYDPTYRPDNSSVVLHGGPFSAQFSGPVTLSGSASLTVHTLQVDATRTFTLSGGTLAFNTINLMPDSVTPAKLAVNGTVNFSSVDGSNATIANGTGSGTSGKVDLVGGNGTFSVASGVGLFVEVPVANGGLIKSGAGTMHLDVANTYSGGTTVSAGSLEAGAASSIPGNVTNSAGTLKLDNAAALASGATLTLASSPAAGAVNLNFSGTQTISTLCFGTTRKAAGTWAASGATHNNGAFTGSGILNVTTGPATTTTVARTAGSSPCTYGTSLTFTATVSGNAPTGTIQFKVDGVNSGGLVTLAGGSASLVISTLTIAGSPHQITAYYSGDDNNNPSDDSASPFLQLVTAAPTSCALVSSMNPAGPGTNVTFTATVSPVPPGVGTPTGNVVFAANGSPFATNTLFSGSTTASTVSLPLGTNTMTAQYAAGGNFLGSTGSLAQVIVLPVTCSQTNELVGIVNNLDGTLTLTFVGTPQAQYYVLSSADLGAPTTGWAPVAGSTNTVTNTSGFWQFIATNTAPQQYYRSSALFPCP